MMIRMNRFNIYLLLALAMGLASGCSTTEEKQNKKLVSTFRFFIEVNPDFPGLSEKIEVHGVPITVQKQPILNESDIKEATVIQVEDDFAITLQLEDRAKLLFEQYTAGNPKKHMVLFAQWVEPDKKEANAGRFLAAPRINSRVTNGVLTFTPDATHEEAERIVKGLNNIIKKRHSKESF